MTSGWWQLTPETRHLAETLLTKKQLDVLKLNLNGCSTYRIGIMLDIAEPTARAHLNRAHQKLGNALRKDAA